MLSEVNIQVQVENWTEFIDALLETHSQGISEYEIIKQLRLQDYLHELESNDAPLGGLFPIHFLLMHVVYSLQQKARLQGNTDITISPLNIQRLPYRPGEQAVATPDKLSTYYLDISNLFTTSEDEVNQWLDNFWQRYLLGDEKQETVAVLGISEPISRTKVETRYRQLAMKHHPDRGGDSAQLAEINHAVEVLRKIYRR